MPQGFDETRIANLALSKCGSKNSIESLNENSTEAVIAKTWYDVALRVTLESHNWSFARKIQQLAKHDQSPPELRWSFRYQIPADCIVPREIENPAGTDADAIPFSTELADLDNTMSLVTNAEDARLIYTFEQRNTILYSMFFVDMTATKLGEFINPQLTGKPETTRRLERAFGKLMVEAPSVDASSEIPREERDASWIRDRS